MPGSPIPFRRRTRLGNGFRDVLRTLAGARKEHACRVGLSTGRSLGCASVKKSYVSMLAAGGAHYLSLRDRRRQNDHIRVDVQLFIGNQVRRLYHKRTVALGTTYRPCPLHSERHIRRTTIENSWKILPGVRIDVEHIDDYPDTFHAPALRVSRPCHPQQIFRRLRRLPHPELSRLPTHCTNTSVCGCLPVRQALDRLVRGPAAVHDPLEIPARWRRPGSAHSDTN